MYNISSTAHVKIESTAHVKIESTAHVKIEYHLELYMNKVIKLTGQKTTSHFNYDVMTLYVL